MAKIEARLTALGLVLPPAFTPPPGVVLPFVNVRLIGDCAIIHARTTYRMSDGRPGSGRYTDIWARRNGRWLAVAAHVTRC